MTARMIRLSALLAPTVVLLLVAPQASADHVKQLAANDESQCSGAHCSTTATFIRVLHRNPPNYHVAQIIASMDTHASNARLTAPLQALVDVQSSGDAGALAAHLWDTPPITFEPGGILQIDMTGMADCRPFESEGECEEQPQSLLEQPVVGTYGDQWVARLDTNNDGTYETVTSAVSCTTNDEGTLGTCQATEAVAGKVVQLKITRTVTNLVWRNGNTPVAYDANISNWPPVGNPYPIVMRSSVLVTFGCLDKPDLLVPTVSYAPASPLAGDLMTFSGVVQNTGGVAAGASHARLRIDISNNGTWDVTPPTVATGALTSGETTTATWTNVWASEAGTHQFEISADADNEVNECSENNNQATMLFTVQRRPNLVVPGTPAGDAPTLTNTTPAPGQSVTFRAKVLNNETTSGVGAGTAPSGHDLRFCLPGTAAQCEGGTTIRIGNDVAVTSALAPDAKTAYLNATTGWSTTTPGTYRFWACADVNKEVRENPPNTNETDNCTPRTFTVQASGNDAPYAIAGMKDPGGTEYYQELEAIQNVPTPVALSASSEALKSPADPTDTDSRDGGSDDPDGWTNATKGMSGGGAKCEWDLNNNGVFGEAVDRTITNPAAGPPGSPAVNCDLNDLGNVTFTQLGTHTFRLRLTDRFSPPGVSNTAEVRVKVMPPPPQCSGPSSLLVNQLGVFSVTNGTPPYTWTTAPAGTPAGAGPSAATTFSTLWTTTGPKTVTVTDSHAPTRNASCSVAVAAPAASPLPFPRFRERSP